MLTRIEIDGFKTFKDFALDVPPFFVVLGRNAAGKSNLFDAIAFLARLAGGATVMQAVREDRSRLHEMLHRDSAGRSADTVRFAVDLAAMAPTLPSRVRYELTLRVLSEDPSDAEGTQTLVVTGERWLTAGPEGSPGWREATYTPIPDGPEAEATSLLYPARYAFRDASTLAFDGRSVDSHLQPVVAAVRREIAAWHVLSLDPTALRSPDGYDDDDRLASTGAHLPNTLARIVRRTRRPDRPRGALSDIVADLATVIPEVVDVRVDEYKLLRSRNLFVTTTEEGEFAAEAVSDGTLRALALVTALHDPQGAGLWCIEEPENGIYPERIHRLVEILRHYVATGGQRQVMIASHSPDVFLALPAPGEGQLVRDDCIFLDLVSRQSGDVIDKVSRPRRVRGGAAPLPQGFPEPLVSFGEIKSFLGRER